MSKLIITLVLAVAVMLVGCANDRLGLESAATNKSVVQEPGFAFADDSSFVESAVAARAPSPMAEMEVIREVVREMETSGDGAAGMSGAMQTSQRKVISSASISLVVDVVETAIKQAQTAVEGLGGFVEHLSSSGGSRQEQANMTLRVPQEQFSTAVAVIEGLGVVESRNLGSEDVSAQFIDLGARLKSSLGEEKSLLSLLERTSTVGEILAIERELFRVRADIERSQGQLNFLERRVDLATINLFLVPLEDRVAVPPSASLSIEVTVVGERVNAIKAMVASVDGTTDGVFHSLRFGRERADLTLNVFTRDFDRIIEFLEDQGEVLTKELTEETSGTVSGSNLPEKPNGRIQVSLLDESGVEGFPVWGVIGIILGSIAGSVVIIFLGYRGLMLIRQRGSGGRFE
jgi:hypothetical protein